MEKIRQELENLLWEYILTHCGEYPFGRPIVRFADANDDKFAGLKKLVSPNHHMPSDFLKNARSIVSYALPIQSAVAKRNAVPGLATQEWSDVYLLAGKISAELNDAVVKYFQTRGIDAASPIDCGLLPSALSNWSQRHVAYIAGHGTFGLNNMLISDAGSVVRYYSVVTALEVVPDKIPGEERCLYKRNGSCAKCVNRCESGALTIDKYDRFACFAVCMKNQEVPGADVCGKCIVDLPCSHSKWENSR